MTSLSWGLVQRRYYIRALSSWFSCSARRHRKYQSGVLSVCRSPWPRQANRDSMLKRICILQSPRLLNIRRPVLISAITVRIMLNNGAPPPQPAITWNKIYRFPFDTFVFRFSSTNTWCFKKSFTVMFQILRKRLPFNTLNGGMDGMLTSWSTDSESS
jgi:hypothetical protein